jgi:hypothetical protein
MLKTELLRFSKDNVDICIRHWQEKVLERVFSFTASRPRVIPGLFVLRDTVETQGLHYRSIVNEISDQRGSRNETGRQNNYKNDLQSFCIPFDLSSRKDKEDSYNANGKRNKHVNKIDPHRAGKEKPYRANQ